MEVKKATFVMSNSDVDKCPNIQLPEYAFIGRSNVGKSSLINMLTNQKQLAKTSQKPGKTQLINHYIINDEWYLVDLPGYGYAARNKTGKEQIQTLIYDYILKRATLTSLFVLIDSRHSPQKNDLEFMGWLGINNIPFAIVFTKIDKISKNQLVDNIRLYKEKMSEEWEETPIMLSTSSVRKEGSSEILSYIEQINNQLKLFI